MSITLSKIMMFKKLSTVWLHFSMPWVESTALIHLTIIFHYFAETQFYHPQQNKSCHSLFPVQIVATRATRNSHSWSLRCWQLTFKCMIDGNVQDDRQKQNPALTFAPPKIPHAHSVLRHRRRTLFRIALSSRLLGS